MPGPHLRVKRRSFFAWISQLVYLPPLFVTTMPTAMMAAMSETA